MPTERKPRKPRADYKEQAVKAMVAEKTVTISPPKVFDFDKEQHDAFDEVIGEFAKVDWSAHTIRLAALLARSLDLMRIAQDNVIDEGFTVSTARGGTGMNPSVSALNILASQVMTMRRSLALHATAGSRTLDVKKRQGINKCSADDAPDDDDNLLAVPAPLRVVR